MKSIIRCSAPVLAMLATALMSSCGVEGSSFFVSDQQEAEIGAEVHNEVIAEYPLIEDPDVTAWVADLGGRIASASAVERDGVQYRFHVVEADFVNAFAAPGGYIYLTRELILQAQNEAEVAGVLGHEVGHVAHRHGVAKLERAALAGVIGDLFFGDGTLGDDALSFVTSFVLNTDYSQDQETDSDLQGVRYTHDAGISPFGLVDFFFFLESISSDSFVPDWLSSHPAPLDRAANTQREIERIHPGLTRDTPGFAWEPTGRFEEIQTILAR